MKFIKFQRAFIVLSPLLAQAAHADDTSEAQRLALEIHTQAAAIDKLPRFSYRIRYRHGVVAVMRTATPFFH